MEKSVRTFVFLQGPPSRFWGDLAASLERAGHRVLKVNFSAAERLYWRTRPGRSYRGSLKAWGGWLAGLIREEGVTDILYYGDQHPYHRIAADLAPSLGVTPFVIEFGYLRPSWITLEKGGMGAWSHFPDEASQIRALAERLETIPQEREFRYPFGVEAFNEVFYHLVNVFLFFLYPRYQADRFYHPVVEYLSTFLRWARQAKRGKREQARFDAVAGRPFVLIPLQLQNDVQIRFNSPYSDQREMLREVFASFARHAPADLSIVVKQHPMDVGMIDWTRIVGKLAAEYGVGERVVAIDGGVLPDMLAKARAVLVINSTVGLHALRAGRPTKVLGTAVYDIGGLSAQMPLDAFWSDPGTVDMSLVADLVRGLAGTIQVPGSFYNPEGSAAARRLIVERLLADAVNGEGAFVDPPPRLARQAGHGARPASETNPMHVPRDEADMTIRGQK